MSLVSNGVDASCELVGAGVEVCGKDLKRAVLVVLNLESGGGDVSADHLEELLTSLVSEGVGLGGVSLPSVGVCSDSSDHLVVDGVSLVGGGHSISDCHDETDYGELE